MKKYLFLILAFYFTNIKAQTTSPQWTTAYNLNMPASGVRPVGISNVGNNIVWTLGYDNSVAAPQYDLFSKSTDGGITFSGGIIPNSVLGVRSPLNLEPIDGNLAWVATIDIVNATDSKLIKTTDGGVTWNIAGDSSMFGGTGSAMNFVCFTDATNGIACGDAFDGEFEIWKTNDSGNTWNRVDGLNIPNPDSSMLPYNNYGSSPYLGTNCFTKSGSHIWFYTYGNQIYHSANNGTTWQSSLVNISSGEQIVDIEFNDANIGILKIFAGSATNFKFSHTTDGGATWSTPTLSTAGNYGGSDLGAVPGTNIFVATGFLGGNQYLSYTSDFGNTWTNWGSIGIGYLGIRFSDANHGWASSDIGNAGGKMYKYNGGTLTIEDNLNTSENPIEIYPNPIENELIIHSQLAGKIVVINSLGENIFEDNIKEIQKINFNTTQIPSGIYFISLHSKNGIYSYRFIKK